MEMDDGEKRKKYQKRKVRFGRENAWRGLGWVCYRARESGESAAGGVAGPGESACELGGWGGEKSEDGVDAWRWMDVVGAEESVGVGAWPCIG